MCSYVVRFDSGLAPNPFLDYCTLAVCTPNHMGIRVKEGDWIIGSTIKRRGNKLLFAMEISEKLEFDNYYIDKRFENKRPVKGSINIKRMGDNMYYKDNSDNWRQHPTDYHDTKHDQIKDLKHPFVFVGENFYYFGKNAVEFPIRFRELIRTTQGCKSNFSLSTVTSFVKWLSDNFETGIHGEPYDKNYQTNKNFIGINEL
ncbi:MAG: hypothetical protein ABI986_07845 [Chloroflexota bacterium]